MVLLEWMEQFVIQFGYLGVFFISFIGTMSIIIPIPYTLVILLLSMRGAMNPLLLTIAGGIGSGIGEFSGYALGYYGRTMISKKRQRKMNYMVKVLDRYGPIVIFLFALTPLPDDLLFVPLGILRYSFIKAFIPCFLGKLLMCGILAFGGQLYYDVLLIIFGEMSWEIEILTSIITAVALMLTLVAMFKIDWEKLLKKYVDVEAKERVESNR
ncbi:MAG: VTT domain-containing protein [Candidatus Bathyarchaeota archaeon]|nr:MAG: VTT domain-containing protein [Candidatus Bathyarchaeota archaeon]